MQEQWVGSLLSGVISTKGHFDNQLMNLISLKPSSLMACLTFQYPLMSFFDNLSSLIQNKNVFVNFKIYIQIDYNQFTIPVLRAILKAREVRGY